MQTFARQLIAIEALMRAETGHVNYRGTATSGVRPIDLELEMLVGMVRGAFPLLPFTRAEIEDRGGDHRVLLLDNEYVFRFPREPENHLRLELAVLSALQRRCDIPTPRYEFVAPDSSFAGYRFLRGTELSAELFGSLRKSAQYHILDQAVLLLQALHGLVPRQIATKRGWRKTWTARQFADRGRQRLAMFAPHFSALALEVENFYRLYEDDQPSCVAVLHGDLVEDHLLLSADRDGLAGVIDFGDVGLGDPADDLKGFWAYGAAAAAYVIERYDEYAHDPGLRDRSRRAYIRYRIDRFAEQLSEHSRDSAKTAAAYLHQLMADFHDG